MKCPKCEKEMMVGFIGPSKGSVFWAKDEYFDSKIMNLFTEKDAIENGGMHIPIRTGVVNDRTRAWACECCKFVLIDCN